ncbi:MAG: hypothetical protein KGI38_11970 [Thaumarchaeota archaeon]|nr:hypothetical protein [Nitrososphaerota archaeon]
MTKVGTGQEGETIAAGILQSQGYYVERPRAKTFDIIASKGDVRLGINVKFAPSNRAFCVVVPNLQKMVSQTNLRPGLFFISGGIAVLFEMSKAVDSVAALASLPSQLSGIKPRVMAEEITEERRKEIWQLIDADPTTEKTIGKNGKVEYGLISIKYMKMLGYG